MRYNISIPVTSPHSRPIPTLPAPIPVAPPTNPSTPLDTLLQRDSARLHAILTGREKRRSKNAGLKLTPSLAPTRPLTPVAHEIAPVAKPEIKRNLPQKIVYQASAVLARLIPQDMMNLGIKTISHLMFNFEKTGHRENIPATGSALLVANHVSSVDYLIVAATTNRPVRFMMRWNFYFLFEPLFEKMGGIPIAKGSENPQAKAWGLEQTARALRNGELVVIFPEGILNTQGNNTVEEFKRGVEMIVTRTPVPVIPVAFEGMWHSAFSLRKIIDVRRREQGEEYQYGTSGANPRDILHTMMNPLNHRLYPLIRVDVGTPVAPQDVTAAKLQTIVRDMLVEIPDPVPLRTKILNYFKSLFRR